MTAQHYIDHLKLLPHPEGGYYKETYRAEEIIGEQMFARCVWRQQKY
jgi:predicted cupin superfamily sugar epimerase